MIKIAEQVKVAEVRGAIAAFMDAGLMKTASSQQEFDAIVDAVSANLDDNYDMQKIASVTDAVLSNGNGMQKVAAETARNAALGELLMMKTAGQIDNDTCVKAAQELMKIAATAEDYAAAFEAEDRKLPSALKKQLDIDEMRKLDGRKVSNNIKLQGGGITGGDVKPATVGPAIDPGTANKLKDFLYRDRKVLGAGAGAAGLVGGTLLAKNLYDKYSN